MGETGTILPISPRTSMIYRCYQVQVRMKTKEAAIRISTSQSALRSPEETSGMPDVRTGCQIRHSLAGFVFTAQFLRTSLTITRYGEFLRHCRKQIRRWWGERGRCIRKRECQVAYFSEMRFNASLYTIVLEESMNEFDRGKDYKDSGLYSLHLQSMEEADEPRRFGAGNKGRINRS